MFIILCNFLLISACFAVEPSLITRFDSNEINIENEIQLEHFFPTIDPSIAEDAKLTTVST